MADDAYYRFYHDNDISTHILIIIPKVIGKLKQTVKLDHGMLFQWHHMSIMVS